MTIGVEFRSPTAEEVAVVFVRNEGEIAVLGVRQCEHGKDDTEDEGVAGAVKIAVS